MHVHESPLKDRQNGSYVGHAGMHPRIRLVMHIDVNIVAFQRIDIGSRGLEKIVTHTRRCL
jgi:hypothetical protein